MNEIIEPLVILALSVWIAVGIWLAAAIGKYLGKP